MMDLPRIVALLAGALLLLGCQGGRGPGEGAPAPMLAGTSWRLLSVSRGDDLWDIAGAAAEPTLAFERDPEGGDLKVSGFAGVNRFFGSCTLTAGGRITVGPLGTTRMAGPPALMSLEDAYLAALGGAETCEVTAEGDLVLSGDGGTARLARR